ncbi:hypothetical protein EC973_004351 [Apophysomyces ossiformis]|uniref:Uncharacterized protein n=1 Tax=Apophysomyces ossiformis TaxID=679940 RepID=A0A8H7BGX9_9FUNG|nr:hypothetical protein EC973_004351 [Apophysomyces ossiformis]
MVPLNAKEPTIHRIQFTENTGVVHLTQHLCPRIFPWIELHLPLTATVKYRETSEGTKTFKVEQYEESWTIEGLIKCLPWSSLWYDRVLRVLSGAFLSMTGKCIVSLMSTKQLLVKRSEEIEQAQKELSDHNARQLEKQQKSEGKTEN